MVLPPIMNALSRGVRRRSGCSRPVCAGAFDSGEDWAVAHIKVDFQDIKDALDHHGGQMTYYLDKKTGEVIRYIDDFELVTGEEDTFSEQLEDEPERYEAIEPLPSNVGYRIMEDFTEALHEGKEKRVLLKALAWKKPFWNFKDALFDMPELREQWLTHHARRMVEEARDWLRQRGIDAELAGPKVVMDVISGEDEAGTTPSPPSGNACPPDKPIFWERLAAGFCAGQPLLPMLRSIERELAGTPMGVSTGALADAVEQNVMLSEAMERQPEVFSAAHVHLMRAGELFGRMDAVALLMVELNWRCPDCGHM